MNDCFSPKIEILSQKTDFAFVGEYYTLAEVGHFWIQWRTRAFFNQLKCLGFSIDENMLGLEIGCGNGVLRSQIEGLTGTVVDGVELDLNALKLNRQGRGRLFLYDILQKKKELEGRYDFILLFDVIEHVGDVASFLKACLFHLKPDGKIFINVPAFEFLRSSYDDAQGHIRRYNKQLITSQLSISCANILDVRYWGFSLVPLLMLRKICISKDQSNDEIIKKGFKPPHKLMNMFFKMLMNMETSILKNPPAGTSVLAVVQKTHKGQI